MNDVTHRVVIDRLKDGRMHLSAPMSCPVLCLQMIEAAQQLIIAQCAARELQGAIEIAAPGDVPPANGVNRLKGV